MKVGAMKCFSMQNTRNYVLLRQMEVHSSQFKRVEGYKNQSHNLLKMSHDRIAGKVQKREKCSSQT
jgi:hypothetical protein